MSKQIQQYFKIPYFNDNDDNNNNNNNNNNTRDVQQVLSPTLKNIEKLTEKIEKKFNEMKKL